MTKKCTICGNPNERTEDFCVGCSTLISTLYHKYTRLQLMNMYAHVLGIKIIQDITDFTYDKLKKQYETEKAKEEVDLD